MIKTIPRKRNAKRQNGCLRRPCKYEKSKRQRRKGKIYPFDAEFQRIARRDKKAFISEQCKEIEYNNRMGKTTDLFKQIRDTKGTFQAKMSSIKDRNGRDQTEAEISRRGGQNSQKNYTKKNLMT